MSAGRHRVLIVGVGSIGERHLRCFQATGRAELSFVETDATQRQSVAERHGTQRCFADLESALAEPPDAAVIATPAPLHVPQATQLAQRGVHLLIEKPLGVSRDGVGRLREVVRQHGVTAGVAYVYRCHPLLVALRRRLEEGHLGRAVQLVVTAGQHFPTYRPAYRHIYYADRAAGGGAIQDALTHLVNAGEWLLGPIDRLVADAAHLVLEGVEVEDTVHLLARHGPALASYSLNQHQAANEVTFTVVCEHGTLRAEFHELRWRWLDTPGGAWHDEVLPALERDTLFLNQAHAYLNALEGAGRVPCTLEEGIQTLEVNLAALASVEQKAWQMTASRPSTSCST
jgi:predicted dehydrogenase